MRDEDFIEALVQQLLPVRRAPPALLTLAVFSAAAWPIVGLALLATGPLRDDSLSSLLSSPRYASELGLTILVSSSAVRAGLEIGVPGQSRPLRLSLPVCGLVIVWVGLIVYGLFHPALATTGHGARPHCTLQTFLLALPPLGLGFYALSKRALYARARAGFLVGLGAATIPVAWMQLACLYEPRHTIVAHLIPVVALALLSASAARWVVCRT